MIEHRFFIKSVTDEVLEQIAHFAELREDKYLLVSINDTTKHIEQHSRLSRQGCIHAVVLEILRRMIANLLQGKHHLQNKSLALEKSLAVFSLHALYDSHTFVDGLLV